MLFPALEPLTLLALPGPPLLALGVLFPSGLSSPVSDPQP